jgi:putative membrane protein
MPWVLLAIAALLVASENARPRVHRRLVVAPWGDRELRGVLWRDSRGWRVGRSRVADPHGLLGAHAMGEPVAVRAEIEWRRGPASRVAGMGAALGVLALSGLLGLAALRMGARSPVGLPADALLPLLGGLFACPSLLAAARSRVVPARARLRAPRPARGEVLRAAGPGAAASALLGIAPGVSASMAALLTPRAKESERALVALGAVNGGAVVFGVLAWDVLGKARHGALVAAERLSGRPAWTPTLLAEQAALLLAAAGIACVLARAASSGVARLPPKPLALAGLALLVAMAALSGGAWGLVVLSVSASVGLLPARLGVRRTLCMGVILVPALLRAWGL